MKKKAGWFFFVKKKPGNFFGQRWKVTSSKASRSTSQQREARPSPTSTAAAARTAPAARTKRAPQTPTKARPPLDIRVKSDKDGVIVEAITSGGAEPAPPLPLRHQVKF